MHLAAKNFSYPQWRREKENGLNGEFFNLNWLVLTLLRYSNPARVLNPVSVYPKNKYGKTVDNQREYFILL